MRYSCMTLPYGSSAKVNLTFQILWLLTQKYNLYEEKYNRKLLSTGHILNTLDFRMLGIEVGASSIHANDTVT